MQYIKFQMVPGRGLDELRELDASFSEVILIDSSNNYYAHYDDDVDLSGLPDWVQVIDEAEYLAKKDEMTALSIERTKKSIDDAVKRALKNKYEDIEGLMMEVSYAKHSIPQLCADGRTVDDVVGHCVVAINDADTLDELNTAEDAVKNKTLDFSSHIPDTITDQATIDRITEYYYTITEGIIAYRKRRLLKDWAATKKANIDGSEMPEDLFSDMPQI